MGKAAAVRKDEEQPLEQQEPAAEAEKDYAELTYVPLNRDDPHTVEWHGIKFLAFVPVKVSLKHTYLVPTRRENTLLDGTVVTKHVEAPISLVELARGNPSFLVDGVQCEKKEGRARTPETAPEYRGYCIRWIAESLEPRDMDARWDAESQLRQKCQVEAADIAYLRPFFDAQKEVLADRLKTIAKRRDHVVA